MNKLIIYNTPDGESSIALYAKDGSVWLNQNQLSDLFGTSKQIIGQHIASILADKELSEDSVVKHYFTTASDGNKYNVAFYSLEMIMATSFGNEGELKQGRLLTAFLTYFSAHRTRSVVAGANITIYIMFCDLK